MDWSECLRQAVSDTSFFSLLGPDACCVLQTELIVLWLCCSCFTKVDPAVVLGGNSVGVSQTTLLSLVHQLAADLHTDVNTALKMAWLNEAAPAIDPHDPVTAPHIKGVLSGVMGSLKQLVNSLPATDATAKKAKITLHLFNSLLHQ